MFFGIAMCNTQAENSAFSNAAALRPWIRTSEAHMLFINANPGAEMIREQNLQED